MGRLRREGNPPEGQLASPVPQAWDPSTNDYREITGSPLGPGRFGTDVQLLGRTANGSYLPIRINAKGQIEFAPEVKINGSAMELFGPDITERPLASEVPIGATFTVVNNRLDTWVSNGTEWLVV